MATLTHPGPSAPARCGIADHPVRNEDRGRSFAVGRARLVEVPNAGLPASNEQTMRIMNQNNDKNAAQKSGTPGSKDPSTKPAANGTPDTSKPGAADKKKETEKEPDTARTTMNTGKEQVDNKNPK